MGFLGSETRFIFLFFKSKASKSTLLSEIVLVDLSWQEQIYQVYENRDCVFTVWGGLFLSSPNQLHHTNVNFLSSFNQLFTIDLVLLGRDGWVILRTNLEITFPLVSHINEHPWWASQLPGHLSILHPCHVLTPMLKASWTTGEFTWMHTEKKWMFSNQEKKKYFSDCNLKFPRGRNTFAWHLLHRKWALVSLMYWGGWSFKLVCSQPVESNKRLTLSMSSSPQLHLLVLDTKGTDISVTSWQLKYLSWLFIISNLLSSIIINVGEAFSLG